MVSDAQARATRKYRAKAYDRIEIQLPKGSREKIKAHADTVGQSVNAYISQAISARMESEIPDTQEAHTSPVDAQGGGVVSVPMESREDATGRE